MKFANEERFDLNPRQLERFESHFIIDNITGCWIWIMSKDKDGYGKTSINGIFARAHRVAYEHYRQVKADGILDHIVCDNKSCVNPYHVEVSTMRENTLRGTAPSALNARKTVCQNGHPFDKTATHKGVTRRICTICHAERRKAWKQREKARRQNENP